MFAVAAAVAAAGLAVAASADASAGPFDPAGDVPASGTPPVTGTAAGNGSGSGTRTVAGTGASTPAEQPLPPAGDRIISDDDPTDGLAGPGGTATGGPPMAPPRSIGVGYIHQFDANLDDGGSLSVDRFYGSLSSRLFTSGDFSFTLAMGYEFGWYHWSDSPLGTAKPWSSVNLFGLQARGSFRVAPDWMATVAGLFGIAGETDADAGSSLYGGGLASISYAPSPEVVLGIGVLGVTQIENPPIIIPVPVVHWHFAEEWVLSTIRRPPASPFVGVDLAWEPAGSKADVSVGIGWQQRRFRLGPSSDPTTSNGVGLDQTWAAYATVGYDVLPTLRIDGLIGVQFLESLELQDSRGNMQRDADVDPNALLGVFLTWSF